MNTHGLFAVIPRVAAWLLAMFLGTPMSSAGTDTADVAQQQVLAAERGFARAMAERDREAFAEHVSEEAVFFTAAEPYRGKPQVLAGWARFFEGPTAPFSWAPDRVEVLASGSLALSTGRVRDPAGKVIGRFNSIWREEAPGRWRVVFDKGSPPEPDDLR